MAEERTFSQEEVNQIVEERIARAREKWQKESESSAETENLEAGLQARDEELAQIKHERFLEKAHRDVRAELEKSFGVTDEGRIERIMKFIDFSEASDSSFALAQLDNVARDLPELVRPRGAGSGGSSKPILPREEPLTREDVEKMSEVEINSNWERVKAFLAGERG
jgi:hypothetical protein